MAFPSAHRILDPLPLIVSQSESLHGWVGAALSHVLRIERARLGHVLPIAVAGAVLGIHRIKVVAGRATDRRQWRERCDEARRSRAAGAARCGSGRLSAAAATTRFILVAMNVLAAVHDLDQRERVGCLTNSSRRGEGDRVGRGCCEKDQEPGWRRQPLRANTIACLPPCRHPSPKRRSPAPRCDRGTDARPAPSLHSHAHHSARLVALRPSSEY